MSECLEVWEREVSPDRIVWGRCRKPKGHDGQCGPVNPGAFLRAQEPSEQ